MESRQSPLVSVLISARNRAYDLLRTLHSLKRQQYQPLEIIVIDDASDASLEPVVRSEWPDAFFVRNPASKGYIANRSFGMNLARGKYILSLDDDSELTSATDLARAIQRIEREPKLGLITFYVHQGPALPSGDAPADAEERYVPTFVGCGHLVRKEVARTVGGYRDFFFYYGEESEYVVRMLDAGWRVLFFPSVVVHHRTNSVGRSDGRIWGHSFRNELWSILLNVPWLNAIKYITWKGLVNTVECLRRLEIKWFVWAIGSFLCGLPHVIRLRRPVHPSTLRRLNALRFRRIHTEREFELSAPPDLAELWSWFCNVWWNRRRAPAYWQSSASGCSEFGSFCTSRTEPHKLDSAPVHRGPLT